MRERWKNRSGRSLAAGVAVSFCLALATACSGTDKTSTPVEKCQDLYATYCDKSVECVPPSDRGREREDCDFYVMVNIDCGQVVGVSPNYDRCIAQIQDISCVSVEANGGVVFPPVCMGAVFTNGAQ